MANRSPLVLVSGEFQALQSGDTITFPTQTAMDNSLRGATTAYVDKTRWFSCGMATSTLVNAVGYVFGSMASTARTGFQTCSVGVPYTGTITRIQFTTSTASGGTTGQTITLYKNNSSQGSITSSYNNSTGVHVLDITGLNISVTSGDYLEFNFSAGAAATNTTIQGMIFYVQ